MKDPESDLSVGAGVSSIGEVHEIDPMSVEDSHQDGEFHRVFTQRQIHVISLGSNIGSGLFIATGKALANGGPASMIVGYGIVASCVTTVLQTISEMTIAFPTSGNFIDYIDRFVDPALAFSAAFAEWIGWSSAIGAEATFFSLLINYWAQEKVHEAVWITLYVVFVGLIFCLPPKWFARFEYVTSIIKVAGLIIAIVASFAMVVGAGPNGRMHTGETWRDLPPVKNGFKGVGNAMLLAIWAMGDQIFTGIMGGEAQSPRYSIARATKIVPIRVCAVYMLSILFMTLLVRSDDKRLFGGSSIAASPFVIALNDAGITGVPDFLNAIVMVSVVALGAEGIYVASRILRAMSHQRLIPAFIAKVDGQGRPRWALAFTTALCVLLTYINLSNTGEIVFGWLGAITASSFFMVWLIISITSWRFHAALKAQQDPLLKEVFAFRCVAWPYPPIWLAACSVLFLITCIYLGLYPIGVDVPSVEGFFQYMLGVIVIVTFGLGYKVIYRTKLRDPKTVDLQTGRRTLSPEEISMLREYYSKPLSQRFFSYFQV